MADEVRRVEVGTGRRWWPYVVAALVAWLAAALAFTGDGDDDGNDDDPEGAVATTATTTATTTAGASTTTLVPGTPRLGRDTGWVLVVPSLPSSRLIDVDSGNDERVVLDRVVAARHDGVILLGADGYLRWRPFPVDTDSNDVRLDAPGNARVHPLRGAPLAWVHGPSVPGSREGSLLRLVSLEDGIVVHEVSVSALGYANGVAGDSLVVEAGGDTYAVHVDGTVERLADGTPIAVAADRAIVTVCDETMRCVARAYDVDTGESTEVTGLGRLPWHVAGPASPEGWLPVVVPGGGPVLLGLDGTVLGLPDEVRHERLSESAWSPDGQVLFTPSEREVLAVEPFADGGARVAATYQATVGELPLAVIQPPVED